MDLVGDSRARCRYHAAFCALSNRSSHPTVHLPGVLRNLGNIQMSKTADNRFSADTGHHRAPFGARAVRPPLARTLKFSPNMRIVVSIGNIGFIVTRLMLLFGQY